MGRDLFVLACCSAQGEPPALPTVVKIGDVIQRASKAHSLTVGRSTGQDQKPGPKTRTKNQDQKPGPKTRTKNQDQKQRVCVLKSAQGFKPSIPSPNRVVQRRGLSLVDFISSKTARPCRIPFWSCQIPVFFPIELQPMPRKTRGKRPLINGKLLLNEHKSPFFVSDDDVWFLIVI